MITDAAAQVGAVTNRVMDNIPGFETGRKFVMQDVLDAAGTATASLVMAYGLGRMYNTGNLLGDITTLSVPSYSSANWGMLMANGLITTLGYSYGVRHVAMGREVNYPMDLLVATTAPLAFNQTKVGLRMLMDGNLAGAAWAYGTTGATVGALRIGAGALAMV